MARINIEQVWWTDPRREKLANSLGSLLLADAVVIRAWKLAQDFWGNNRGLIPKHVFETLEANANLIQANLAEVREDGVYVRGSSQYLDWVTQRRDAAKRGGQKSSEKRTQNKQKPQANAKQTSTKSKQTQASGSISGSISGSSSNSGSVNTPYGQNEVLQAEPVKHKGKKFIEVYSELFKARYGTNPHIDGKTAGIAKRVSESLTIEKITLYLDAFFQLPDSKLIKEKHPIGQFEFKLNEIVVFAETGQFTTHKQAQQADSAATLANTLELIRSGKI